MSKTLTDILIEEAKEKEKYFQDYLSYSKKIKKEAEKFLGKVKVYVFGSILRKNEVAQDIDVLVISPKLEMSQKSKILAKICQEIGFSHPFEIHLITPSEYRDWYRYFIKEKIEI